jgi:hypothetical protein
MKTYVYWIRANHHTDMNTEGYIGVTNDFEARMSRHKSGKSGAHKLYNAIKKYGWNNLIKSPIIVGEEDFCYEMEQKLRSRQEIGWNLAEGGGKPPKHDKNSRKENSNWNNSLFGIKNNPMKNPEIVAKRSGENHHAKSIEYKKAFSEKQIGSNNPLYDSEIRVFKHKSGIDFVGTSYELRIKYDLPKSEVSKVVQKLPKYKSVKGWSYVGLA